MSLWDASMSLGAPRIDGARAIFEVEIRDTWSIGGIPNGGYQTAVLGEACVQAGPHPHLLNISAYFIAPTQIGPARVEVETLRIGKRTSAYQARLVQEHGETARTLALCGDLDAIEGPDWHFEPAPDYPPPDQCVLVRADPRINPKIRDNHIARFVPEHIGWQRGKPSGLAEHGGWLRFADDHEPTLSCLPFFADSIPPTSFSLMGRIGWTPTLELTVQLRARPQPGWIKIRMRTQHMTAGHFEEDVELWDSHGALVAVARQRAMLARPHP